MFSFIVENLFIIVKSGCLAVDNFLCGEEWGKWNNPYFYKKIIPSKKLRFKIIKLFNFIPDKTMLKIQYFIKLKRILNLKKPIRYTEKIQWYKLNYRNPVMCKCVDKYEVRDYVSSKGLSSILNILYGVYNSFDEIDFDVLPEKFIIKTTNGSGTNYICKDKSKLDKTELAKVISQFFKEADASAGREWAYNGGIPKVIIEQLLEDDSTHDKSICDYKFLCFNGKPEYVVYDIDRFTNHKRNIYDTNWNDLHIESDCPCSEAVYPKPENFDEMLECARILSADFPAVRVDLYNINNKIYFGELTFFPWSGYVQYTPDSFDFELGEKFILPYKENL